VVGVPGIDSNAAEKVKPWGSDFGRNGPSAVIHEQLLLWRPTGSHDHRFEAENACGRSNLFHLTMTWKRLGLNRYKADLC
jgi:hypothetical protein